MPTTLFKAFVEFLILFSISTQVAAQLTVNANRTQYSPKDAILLTVESDNPGSSALDVSPLYNDFIILDQKKMMINSYAAAKRTSVVRWKLQLRARKSGYVDIPALSHNEESSVTVRVFVKSTSATRFLPVSDQPIILDAQLKKDDNYEGALFLYTLNIYSDQPLADNFKITPPKITKGSVQFLDRSELDSVEIRNKQYSVIEQRYAIYPSEMGRYIIEGPVFNGAQQGNAKSLIRGNNLEINVRSRQDFDNAKYWLPAKHVTIEQTWKKPKELKVSNTIIREIKLTAQGIPASKLPKLITQTPEIVEIKDITVTLQDRINKQGIEGTRTETQYIQLLERGEITFSKIEIFWWDTQLDNQEQAIIAKQILQVLPGVNGESSMEREIAQNGGSISSDENISVIATDINWTLWALVIMTFFTSAGWIYNLRKMKRIKESQDEGFEIQQPNEKVNKTKADTRTEPTVTEQVLPFNAKAEFNTFQLLGRTCLDNDITTAHRRLLEWANHFWYEQEISNIQDIALSANDPSLSVLLTQMQALLDTSDTTEWQGKELFAVLAKIRA